jgi:hypothetical protein
MSTRLQVVVDEAELTSFRRVARHHGMTLSEWVRQTLRRAERDLADGDVATKLAAVRTAAAHRHPTGDIDQMLAEIDRGASDGPQP